MLLDYADDIEIIEKEFAKVGLAPGGVSSVEDLSKAEEELKSSLKKLAAGDGPHYKLAKVYSASKQVVEGILTEIVADLIDEEENTKNCNVSIWSRPWLENGIEVSFKCGTEPKVTKKHSA
ncbi:sarcocystatin-A-like [Musca vetustissima]|uniref:sarcocystatin-A-like n=1 Tax=Musca vetustissima TaxID=27455 RepID=UPI002AB6875D|nr:sarcocystatin-A-like [Musca vetustissima]